MRLMRFAVKLRMKLAGDEERVFGQLDNFNQFAIRGETAKNEIFLLKTLAIRVIELVAMAVALVNHKRTIEPSRFAADDQLAGLCAKTHGAALLGHSGLLIQHCDYWVRCVRIELG